MVVKVTDVFCIALVVMDVASEQRDDLILVSVRIPVRISSQLKGCVVVRVQAKPRIKPYSLPRTPISSDPPTISLST